MLSIKSCNLSAAFFTADSIAEALSEDDDDGGCAVPVATRRGAAFVFFDGAGWLVFVAANMPLLLLFT